MTTTLLDIGDLTEDVVVGRVTITMRGLSAQDLFGFLLRYPALRELFGEKQKKGETVTEQNLMEAAPRAVFEAIAMSDVNLPRDDVRRLGMRPEVLEKAADAVSRLPISDQLKLVSKFFELTFSDGVGPFVVMLKEVTSKINTMREVAAESVTKSREPSPSAFVVDTPHKKHGVTRLAN